MINSKKKMMKTVIEIPLERWQAIEEKMNKIMFFIEEAEGKMPQEFLTRKEFMERCKISQFVYDKIVKIGKLRINKVGNKTCIPVYEVTRYFDGQLYVES